MEPLEDWLEGMQPRLAGLVDLELRPGALTLTDRSPASLARLEAELLARSTPAADFLERVAGFLGEVLLSAAGGSWAWDERRGLPIVTPDPELGLRCVCPAELVEEARRRGDGDEFGRSLRELERSVAEKQAAAPDWTPVKELTPGLDEDPTATFDSPYLDAWLAKHAEGLPAWLATYAERPEMWDFSQRSLDELEAAARRRVSGPDELAAHPDFADGASWYLGEVLRPAMRAQWCYHPGERDGDNMFVGRPFLDQLIPDGTVAVPFLLIQVALADRGPGVLRHIYDRLT
ncbi:MULTISPECIES: hypothetical protein [unclassified Streptomyces]|uniref:hypothetical protein n=1 Tax=unclassified Streptomyces TaxID=2593676 RepID=UPI00117C5FC4|nr:MULTISPECIES: hypothetical protein [unclassified Streptomyces]MBW3356648.1 hypothetical protein [Streptomyces sp. 09ZI22]